MFEIFQQLSSVKAFQDLWEMQILLVPVPHCFQKEDAWLKVPME